MEITALIAASETALKLQLPEPSEENVMPVERTAICLKIKQELVLAGQEGLLKRRLPSTLLASTKPQDVSKYPAIILVGGTNDALVARRDELRTSMLISNEDKAELRHASLLSLSNKFAVCLEMAFTPKCKSTFKTLKAKHTVFGADGTDTGLFDGVGIFLEWEKGGDARLDSARSSTKADALLAKMELDPPKECCSGSEFSKYAGTFMEHVFPHLTRKHTKASAVQWLIMRLPTSLAADGRRLNDKFADDNKLEEWDYVLIQLVLLLDESLARRKASPEVAAHVEIKRLKEQVSVLISKTAGSGGGGGGKGGGGKGTGKESRAGEDGALWAKSSDKILPEGETCAEGTCNRKHAGHVCQKSWKSVNAISYIWNNKTLLKKTEEAREADFKLG